MLGLIVTIVIVGLVAGALARLLVPGKQHLSIAMTIVLGVIGSFVGGFLGYLIFHKDATDGFLQPSGIIGSVIVLLIWTRVGGHSSMRARTTGTTNLGQASPRQVYPRWSGHFEEIDPAYCKGWLTHYRP